MCNSSEHDSMSQSEALTKYSMDMVNSLLSSFGIFIFFGTDFNFFGSKLNFSETKLIFFFFLIELFRLYTIRFDTKLFFLGTKLNSFGTSVIIRAPPMSCPFTIRSQIQNSIFSFHTIRSTS